MTREFEGENTGGIIQSDHPEGDGFNGSWESAEKLEHKFRYYGPSWRPLSSLVGGNATER